MVLATYNWSSVLRHAVRSVLWQTYPNLELLVIGDACTDDSEEVVASFSDERVVWRNLEVNSGNQSTPNNVGLEMARGEYVAYQGHDDIWHPRHLAALVSYLQRGDAEFGCTLAEVLGPPRSRIRHLTGLPREGDPGPGTWLPPTSIAHSAELGRRIGGWRTWDEAEGAPDVDFVDRVRSAGTRVVRVPALTAFKFPSAYRPGAYRERPSHEQEDYLRRIERERFFVERELAGVAWRRISPRKGEAPPRLGTESGDYRAQRAYLRRVRGLD